MAIAYKSEKVGAWTLCDPCKANVVRKYVYLLKKMGAIYEYGVIDNNAMKWQADGFSVPECRITICIYEKVKYDS